MAYLWHRSGYLESTFTPPTLIRVPAEKQHTPDTGQGTWRVLLHPRHWSEYLRSSSIPLTPVRVPGEYLYTSNTDQGTCRVVAYSRHWPGCMQGTCRISLHPWHWSGYLQSTCIPGSEYKRWEEHLLRLWWKLSAHCPVPMHIISGLQVLWSGQSYNNMNAEILPSLVWY